MFHARVTSCNDSVLGCEGTSTSRSDDYVGCDRLVIVFQSTGCKYKTNVAFEMGEMVSYAGCSVKMDFIHWYACLCRVA